MQTHLSIGARLLEHPVERKRVSMAHAGEGSCRSEDRGLERFPGPV